MSRRDNVDGSSRPPGPNLALHIAALLALVLLAYLPATWAGFVWDDDAYVTDNPLLSVPDGLWRIWFSTEHPSQYFPLAYTTLRFCYQLWGLNPAGYHLVNILLHGANVLVVWILLRRIGLDAAPAWLAAALFAVHPVQVETVAWISELKNLQSTLFYLLSLLAWIRFKDKPDLNKWVIYALSLFLYCLALLSKTTACTLPAALILVEWFRNRPLNWRTWLQIAPFCAFGVAMGFLSIWWERHMGHYGDEFGLSFPLSERLLVVGRAFWFYLLKLVVPIQLTFSYPRWHINSQDLVQYFWPLAALVAGIVVWQSKGRLGRGPVVALAFFVATLAPMLGFIQNFTFRYSFVADHYQYLACVGPLTLIAAGLCAFSKKWLSGLRAATGAVLMLAVLASLTMKQCLPYTDLESLLTDIIAKNPQSWMAYANLGLCYLDRGQVKEAKDLFSRALQLNPKCFEAFNNMGLAFAAEGRFDDALQQYHRALEINPKEYNAWNNIGLALALKGQLAESIDAYDRALQINPGFLKACVNKGMALQRLGRGEQAAEAYRVALSLYPQCPEALNNLAWILSTDPNDSLRNGPEALRLAELARRAIPTEDALACATLAAAYAENGRFPEALALALKAEHLAAAAHNDKLANKYGQFVQLFSSGHPLREQPRATSPEAKP